MWALRIREVLEHGEHRDDVELPDLAEIVGKAAADEPEGTHAARRRVGVGRCVRIDADAVVRRRAEPPQETSIGAADVEDPRTARDVRRGDAHADELDEAVERGHAALAARSIGSGPRTSTASSSWRLFQRRTTIDRNAASGTMQLNVSS